MRARLQEEHGEDVRHDLIVLLQRVTQAVVHGVMQLEELEHRRLARRSRRAAVQQAIGEGHHLLQGVALSAGVEVMSEGEDPFGVGLGVIVLHLRQSAEVAERVLERGQVAGLSEVQLPAYHVALYVVEARHGDRDFEVVRPERARRDARESGDRALVLRRPPGPWRAGDGEEEGEPESAGRHEEAPSQRRVRPFSQSSVGAAAADGQLVESQRRALGPA
jgi:hypothetical protein